MKLARRAVLMGTAATALALSVSFAGPALADAKRQVGLVFLRERRDGDDRARQVDALVLAQFTAGDYPAEDVAAGDALDPKFDQAVRNQDAASPPHLAGESLEVRGNQFRVAGDGPRR